MTIITGRKKNKTLAKDLTIPITAKSIKVS
jgi:hypothetical protein